MTFLNPLVLLGLAAAAIPVLLHLLNLRKLKTIEFSTLAFLKELRQSSIRRLKLRQLLLLIVRTLLIIFIVLAFARPALRGTMLGTIGGHAASTIAVIFDDSYTMNVPDERGDRFKQAKEAIFRIADLMKEGDEAYLLRLSDLPKATIEPATHDPSLLKKVVAESAPSPVRRTIAEALRVCGRLFERSGNANREIYIVSDMQATQFTDGGIPRDTVRLFADRVTVYLVRIGSKPVANMAVDSLAVLSAIFEKGKPVTLSASIRNYADAQIRNNVVSVSLGTARVAQRNFSAEAWGSANLEMDATPKQSGFLEGTVEIENDALDFDNHRHFALVIPEVVRATLVSDVPADAQFLNIALHAGEDDTAHPAISLRQTTEQLLPTLDLHATDVLMVSDLSGVSSADARRIADFVNQGGGLILFPSSKQDQLSYTSPLLQAIGIPPVVNSANTTEGHHSAFQKIDFDHPLFYHMFEGDRRGTAQKGEVATPEITNSIVTSPGKNGQIVISLNTGAPFLTDYRVGEGRVLLYAVAPVLSWSDFPLKGVFAPLLFRSVMYTAGRGELLPSYRCGDEPILTLRQSSLPAEARLKLVAPDGSEELLEPSHTAPGASLRSRLSVALKHLAQPGCYRITAGSAILTMFAVNPDPRESDTRMMSSSDEERLFRAFDIPGSSLVTLDAGDQFQSRVLQSRFGVELWRQCIIAALLLALAEMAIARDSRKGMQVT